jgi:mercuric ion transport protein
MPKPTPRTAARWGLLPIGLAALACVGACALPLIAAGGVLGGGLALLRDSCFAPIAIPLIVLGALALVVWILRARRRRRRCQDAPRCECASDGAPNLLQSTTFRPGP